MSERVRAEHQRMSGEELRSVLSHWDLGEVTSIQEVKMGSTRAPKVRVECAEGRFLLKRLAHERADPMRIAFQHRLHRSLQSAGYPVPALIPITSNAGTLLELKGYSYELCRFVDGRRYDGSADDAHSSGSRLAGFHDLTKQHVETAPPGRGYHNRDDVFKAARQLARTRPELDKEQCLLLQGHLERARDAAALQWISLPATVVHGDWHPGNLLYGAWGVSAVLDLETVRVDPRVAELANALLHGAMPVGGAGDAASIEPISTEPMLAMFKGYNLVARDELTDSELEALPSLMLEALSVEAVIALHRKGGFGSWTGPEFLDFVCRRAAWINESADTIRSLAKGD